MKDRLKEKAERKKLIQILIDRWLRKQEIAKKAQPLLVGLPDA
jgi:hypothetical protein